MIDKILGTAGIATVLIGVRMPRMNSIIERWVKTLRAELLDRTLMQHPCEPGLRLSCSTSSDASP